MPKRRAGKTPAKKHPAFVHRPTGIPKDIEAYLRSIEKDKPKACHDLHLLAALVRDAFAKKDVYVDTEQWASYQKIGDAMFKGGLMPWQKLIGCSLMATYRCTDGRPRWSHGLVMMGRGGGKDGTIAWMSLCMTSKNNPVRRYDVDICANNEMQSMRPVKDAIEFLEDPTFKNANRASFYWTSEKIKGLANGGTITGHTNNARGKDGLRSGCVILNEIHEYVEYSNVDVFLTGLGKVEDARSIYFTTNGYVREGVLDNELASATAVLNGESDDTSFFPFICRIDSKEEAHDESCWVKANPSLPYFPSLMEETRKDYMKWRSAPETLPGFMTKRMNLPAQASAKAVTEYEHIKATNRPLPDLKGCQCIVGVDTCKSADMESVTAVFKKDGMIYAINHTWVCAQSKDLPKIKIRGEFPKFVDMGILTIVDDVEIPPVFVTNYIQELKMLYTVRMVCIDDFRYALFAGEFAKIGLSKQLKNLKMVRPSDIAKTVPVIESLFLKDQVVFGDNPLLRWATNNTKVVPWRSNNVGGSDLGNFVYAKIEPRSRKTDPFMSFVHAMTEVANLSESKPMNRTLFRTRTY